MSNPLAITPIPTTGDKLRKIERERENLKVLEREAIQDKAAAEARLTAIASHMIELDLRHGRLIDQDELERLGAPS